MLSRGMDSPLCRSACYFLLTCRQPLSRTPSCRADLSAAFTRPLLYAEGGDAEGATKDRRIGSESHGVEEGHHARQLSKVRGDAPGKTQRDQRHVEHLYLLPAGPRQTVEGTIEGNGIGTGELVTTEDILLNGPGGGAGYVAGCDPGYCPPLAAGDERHRPPEHHV